MKRNKHLGRRPREENKRTGFFGHTRPKLTGRVGQIAELIKERWVDGPRGVVDAVIVASSYPSPHADDIVVDAVWRLLSEYERSDVVHRDLDAEIVERAPIDDTAFFDDGDDDSSASDEAVADPVMTDAQRQALTRLIGEVRGELARYQAIPEKEIDAHFASLQAKRAETRRKTERRVQEDQKKREADKEKEQFYNQPSSEADPQSWLAMPGWYLEETAALSMGKDPSKLNSRTLTKYRGRPTPAEFFRRLDIFERGLQLDEGEIKKPKPPKVAMNWAKSLGLPFPANFSLIKKPKRGAPFVYDWKFFETKLLKLLEKRGLPQKGKKGWSNRVHICNALFDLAAENDIEAPEMVTMDRWVKTYLEHH